MEFKKRQIKKPSNKGFSKKFPMFAFRIPKGDKTEAVPKRIQGNLEALHECLKKVSDKKGSKIVNKNDILLEALDRGLIELKGEYK